MDDLLAETKKKKGKGNYMTTALEEQTDGSIYVFRGLDQWTQLHTTKGFPAHSINLFTTLMKISTIKTLKMHGARGSNRTSAIPSDMIKYFKYSFSVDVETRSKKCEIQHQN